MADESDGGSAEDVIGSRHSRRSFLKKTAAAVTAVGVAAAVPSAALMVSGHLTGVPQLDRRGSTLREPLVAYVRDATKGEVVLMVGTKEVVRNDPLLVAQLVGAWG